MSDAQDELVLFSHVVHKLHRNHARVIRLGKLFRCPVKSPTKTITLYQKSKESTVVALATKQNTNTVYNYGFVYGHSRFLIKGYSVIMRLASLI